MHVRRGAQSGWRARVTAWPAPPFSPLHRTGPLRPLLAPSSPAVQWAYTFAYSSSTAWRMEARACMRRCGSASTCKLSGSCVCVVVGEGREKVRDVSGKAAWTRAPPALPAPAHPPTHAPRTAGSGCRRAGPLAPARSAAQTPPRPCGGAPMGGAGRDWPAARSAASPLHNGAVQQVAAPLQPQHPPTVPLQRACAWRCSCGTAPTPTAAGGRGSFRWTGCIPWT